MSKPDESDLENRSQSQRRRLSFRDAIGESRSDLPAASSQSALQAVAVLHWHSSYSKTLDASTPVERGLSSSGSDGEKRYILGAEFAITAIVAAAAIARRRADLSRATLPVVSDPLGQDEHFSMVKIILGEDRRSDDATVSGATEADGSSGKSQSAVLQGDYLFASSREKIIITQSDSLVSIAERHFHDGNVGWLIADLNSKKLKESYEGEKRIVEIANGEFLELPVWNEIVAFYQGKPDSAIADNLVTIVARRNIDKEIVEAMLAPVVNPPAQEG